MSDAPDASRATLRHAAAAEAAVSVGVSVATVRRWCAAGYLAGVTLPRGGLRIRADSLSRLMGDQDRAR